MHFDKRNINRCQRITQCDTGMGECGGINNDEVGLTARLLHGIDQFMLGIALQGG